MNLDLLQQPIVGVVVIPFCGALVALVVGRIGYRWAAWVSLATGIATLALALSLFAQALTSPASFAGPQSWPVSPTPPTFYADATSAGLTVLVVGLAICLLAEACAPRVSLGMGPGFFPISLALLGMTTALLLSHDLLTFYAAWELTTLCAAFLILTRFDELSGAATSRFLLSSVLLSALGLLAIVWAGTTAGGFDLSVLDRMVRSAPVEARWLLTAALVAMAVFRMAIVPFHVWFGKVLQIAHPPAASLLFAVLPASGFYALVRLVLPHLPLDIEWSTAIAALGLLTALSSSIAALRPKDASTILAYICIGQAGFLAIGMGAGNAAGIGAAAFQLFGFGVSLTLLSLVVRSYSTLFRNAGLEGWRDFAMAQPLAFGAVAVALWGTAGLPPLGGFAARMLLLEALMNAGSETHLVLLGGVLVATALGLAAVIRLVVDAKPTAGDTAEDEPATDWDLFPALVLATAAVLIGFASHWLSTEVFARFASDSLHLSLQAARAVAPWTIPTSALVLLVSLAAGSLVYAVISESEQVTSFPFFARVRARVRRLSFLGPVAHGYWRLADKGAFDVYPAVASIFNIFARVAAFVVYSSAGRGAR